MEYTQLTKESQKGAIRARIKDLETQHMQLNLRVNAPDINMPINEQDAQNLQQLETSIATLREMEAGLG